MTNALHRRCETNKAVCMVCGGVVDGGAGGPDMEHCVPSPRHRLHGELTPVAAGAAARVWKGMLAHPGRRPFAEGAGAGEDSDFPRSGWGAYGEVQFIVLTR
jgi:hypothetical protein